MHEVDSGKEVARARIAPCKLVFHLVEPRTEFHLVAIPARVTT